MEGYNKAGALPELVWLKGFNKGFIPIPKCGITTLEDLFRHGERIKDEDLTPQLVSRWWIVHIREPHDRMESAYRNHRRQYPGFNEDFSDWVIKWVTDPPEFDNRICPQWIFITRKERWRLKLHFVRWDFPAIERMFNIPLAPKNASGTYDQLEWSKQARSLFDEKYYPDILLWKGLVR